MSPYNVIFEASINILVYFPIKYSNLFIFLIWKIWKILPANSINERYIQLLRFLNLNRVYLSFFSQI